ENGASWLFALPGTSAKNGCSDPYHRRSLLDCCFEVAAHTHRKIDKQAVPRPAAIQSFENLPESAEITASTVGRFRKRRNDHQSAQIEVSGRIQGLNYGGQVLLGSTGLCRLVSHLYLRQYRRLSAGFTGNPVQPAGEIHAIYRVNEIE